MYNIFCFTLFRCVFFSSRHPRIKYLHSIVIVVAKCMCALVEKVVTEPTITTKAATETAPEKKTIYVRLLIYTFIHLIHVFHLHIVDTFGFRSLMLIKFSTIFITFFEAPGKKASCLNPCISGLLVRIHITHT